MRWVLCMGVCVVAACGRIGFDVGTDGGGSCGDCTCVNGMCQSGSATCQPGVPCVVECNTAGPCSVDCGQASSCTIECNAPGSCTGGTLTCSSGCTIKCEADNTCNDETLTCGFAAATGCHLLNCAGVGIDNDEASSGSFMTQNGGC